MSRTTLSASAPPAANRWAVLAVLCAALLVVVIDVTVLHIAAPRITEDLRPSAVELLWIVDVYALVVAPLLVAFGTLGDRIGRKRVLVGGLAVFGLASLLAALSPTPLALIGARALLGVGGAMIMPGTMSILRDVFRDRHERVVAVGIWSAVTAAGAAVGPIVGGVLVQTISWNAVFLINLPVVALVIPLALRLLPESRAADPPPRDALGVALAAFGVLGLALGVKQGARHGLLDVVALPALVAGVALLALFARRQLRARRPLLDVRLFADRAFAVAVGCVLLTMFALVGLELFFAQYLQLVLGLEPVAASLRLVPLMLATIVGGLITAPLLRRFSTRAVIGTGLVVTTLALVPMLALGVEDRYLLLAVPLAALGMALETALVAANDVIMSSVTADRAGGAAAIEETAYELGGGLGVAILGSILAAVYSAGLTTVAGVGAAGTSASRESIGRAVEIADELPARTASALVDAARDAFLHGFHVVIAVSIGLLGVSAALAIVLLRGAGGAVAQDRDAAAHDH